MSSKSKTVTPERKAALTQLCDAETYVEIIRQSITPEQAKAHPPIHLANVLSLTAELYLMHFDSIGRSFTAANELAITFNAKLAKDKDNVEIAFLPVAKFKDSASANVEEDEDQPPLGDIAKEAKAEGRAPKSAKSVPRLGNSEPLALPAPEDNVIEAEVVDQDDDDIPIVTKAQPEEVSPPSRTEEEEKAYQEGRTDFADGDNHDDFNPYDGDDESALYTAFRQGWMDKRKEHLDGQCVTGMLSTTAPKFAKMLETVFSNCITQAEYVGILNLALTTERAGKSREWVISRLTEALTKTEQPVERTAFQQGEDAAGNEHIAETANPYEPGTVDHDDWLEGFRSARGEG